MTFKEHLKMESNSELGIFVRERPEWEPKRLLDYICTNAFRATQGVLNRYLTQVQKEILERDSRKDLQEYKYEPLPTNIREKLLEVQEELSAKLDLSLVENTYILIQLFNSFQIAIEQNVRQMMEIRYVQVGSRIIKSQN